MTTKKNLLPDRIKVFVYGTLKRGRVNHSLMGSKARYIGKQKVRGIMFSSGYIPYLCNGASMVTGELWDIEREPFIYIANMELNANYRISVEQVGNYEAVVFRSNYTPAELLRRGYELIKEF